jgi:hypothetical protein
MKPSVLKERLGCCVAVALLAACGGADGPREADDETATSSAEVHATLPAGAVSLEAIYYGDLRPSNGGGEWAYWVTVRDAEIRKAFASFNGLEKVRLEVPVGTRSNGSADYRTLGMFYRHDLSQAGLKDVYLQSVGLPDPRTTEDPAVVSTFGIRIWLDTNVGTLSGGTVKTFQDFSTP